MTLEEIGEHDDALLCITNLTACCGHTNGFISGNWFFPNGTRVPSEYANKTLRIKWDFHRDRGKMMVLLHRRRGGVDGIYRCDIRDSMNVTQNLYIGVYTASTGK